VAEQGAYAALFIARAADGIAVRRAEANVAEHHRLRRAAPAAWKLRALHHRVDGVARDVQLHALADTVIPDLIQYAAADRAIVIPGKPVRWRRPVCATALFEKTPLTAYPRDLTLGVHCLFPVALSGSIAAFTTSPPGEGDTSVYVADLAVLRGRLIDVDAPGSTTGHETLA
jgi:hypothetical protein